MAFKFNVTADELIRAATSVSLLGNMAGRQLQDAYKAIQDMSNVWIGYQFDKVADAANKRVPNFNNTIKVLTNQLPNSMEKVAQTYAAADDEVCGSATYSEIVVVEDVVAKQHEPTQIEFDESQIQSYTEAFIKAVESAIETVESLSGCIPSYWLGFADDQWKAQVKQIEDTIRGSANAVISSINTQSQEARLRLSGAEQSNIDLSDAVTGWLDALTYG